MSNQGLQIFCDREGITLRRAPVGDRYVIQEMLDGGHNLGGEQSGHIIFHDINTTGDGILTGLQLALYLAKSGKKLSLLSTVMEHMPQVLASAKMKKRIQGDIRENKAIDAAITALETKLSKGASSGRILVRASGTEPIVRVMIEGDDESAIKKWAEELAALIEKELG